MYYELTFLLFKSAIFFSIDNIANLVIFFSGQNALKIVAFIILSFEN